jgi:nucleolar protein 4
MGPRQKRQKLNADGAEAAVSSNETQVLSHSKGSGVEKQSTLYIRSLPTETTNATLAEHFSQSFPVKHAVVVTDKETGKCKGYGFVTFVDHEDARRALEEFHGADYGGKKLNVTLAERRHREEGGASREGGEGSGAAHGKEPPQSSKLIIRNLPWSIDSQEKLTKLFLSFGKINKAILPKDHQGRMKGFGIVMLRGRKNAELALERLNGKEIDGRTLAVDWAADKDTWQQAQAVAREAEAEEKAKAKAEGKTERKVEGKAEGKKSERVDSGQSESEDVDEAEHMDVDAEEEDDLDEDEDDFEDVDSNEEDLNEDEEEESKPKMTSNEAVLFIRNLPFTTTDEDLYEHFGELFPVRYARIVIDRETERPRGTGFVCFYKKEDADACIREAPRVAPPKQEKGKGKKGNAASIAPSILENEFTDPSGRYTLDGRILQITRAVDKSEADRLTEEGTATRNKRDRDKRRLFLLGEGTIPSNSPQYEKLSASEIAMRDASAKQRRKLIDSNPSLNISLTRLSVRNIPRSVSTQDLKNLARQAVVGFATDVKGGKRARLSKEELARDTDEIQEADKERRVKKKGIVKQAKIIFEGSEGSKVEESAGRSRGYGFIEYYTHRSALMGLRWLNGHNIDYSAQETANKGKKEKAKPAASDAGERKKRLIVEFAIENAQVVKRRQDREAKARERPKNPKKDETVNVAEQKGRGRGGRDMRKGGKPESGAARRVADKAKKTEATAGGGEDKDKVRQRNIMARKRHDKKLHRRQARGKA